MPQGDPPPSPYELTQHDAHLEVALRGRPRVETVVALFAELERLTTSDRELLVLIDESDMQAALLGSELDR